MPKKRAVKTVARARQLSAQKWTRVGLASAKLFNEINDACGFCELSSYLAKKQEIKRCEICQVKERCATILREVGGIEKQIDKLIDETIRFLSDMDVKEK